MKFSDILGQPVLVSSLQKAVLENKAANGYILSGPKGCGKKLSASIFAAALNCKVEAPIRPCGSCSSCIKFESGNHPNIDIIKPSGASIKIKQIREVISDVSKTSLEAGYKIVIIEHAEKMTHEAQDAFLKTLEEPPEATVFILLTENQHLLLPTIVSRCQVYMLRKVGNSIVEEYLRRTAGYEEEKVKFATAYSNGIIGRAMEILQDARYFNMREAFVRTVELILGNNYFEASRMLSELVSTREEAEHYMEFLLNWFRDIAVYKELQEDSLLANGDKLDKISYYSGFLNDKKLNKILSLIKNTISQLKHNVSTKNSIDGLIMNIMEVNNG